VAGTSELSETLGLTVARCLGDWGARPLCELEELEMTDAFSEYVTLLKEIEQIPVAARASGSLSAEERAATVARVVDLVRDRVLPQSEREEAGLEALLGDGLVAFARTRGASGGVDHDAILAPVDELARADPRRGARVQELLYRLHAAIAGHFGEAELILASEGMEEQAQRHGSPVAAGWPRAGGRSDRGYTGPSAWFG
jgi:hypothetical protein